MDSGIGAALVPSCWNTAGLAVDPVPGTVSNVTIASMVRGSHAEAPVAVAWPPAKSAPVPGPGRLYSTDPGVTEPVIVAVADPTSSANVVPEVSSNLHRASGVSASCSALYEVATGYADGFALRSMTPEVRTSVHGTPPLVATSETSWYP